MVHWFQCIMYVYTYIHCIIVITNMCIAIDWGYLHIPGTINESWWLTDHSNLKMFHWTMIYRLAIIVVIILWYVIISWDSIKDTKPWSIYSYQAMIYHSWGIMNGTPLYHIKSMISFCNRVVRSSATETKNAVVLLGSQLWTLYSCKAWATDSYNYKKMMS